jgi:hypothetical protein
MTDDTRDESGNATETTGRDWELPSRITSRRDVLKTGAAASAVLGLGATGAAVAIDDDNGEYQIGNETETPTEDDTETVDEQAAVAFLNQTTGGSTIVIDSVTVPEGGFVAIHDTSLLDSEVVGSVIGVSDYLEPGTQEEVEVNLFDVPGAEFDQSELEEAQALIAMPHMDTDGDEEYGFVESDGEDDGPYVRSGQAVVDIAYAVTEAAEETPTATPEDTPTATPEDTPTATPEETPEVTPEEPPEDAEEASVTLRNQTSDGSSIEVAAVTLPEGGYVAVHDASLFDGAVVESVIGVSEYLRPGSYVNGEITLYEVPGVEFDQSALEETQALVAMPHQETNDNQEYDFVETGGQDDGPYVQGGQPIINAAFVAVEEETVTETPAEETDTPVDDETATPEDDETATPEDNETLTPEDDETDTPAENETA